MDIVSIIAKKRDGGQLSESEIKFFVDGAVDGSIADYQCSALLMAIRIQGFSAAETLSLTQAMTKSGATLDLSDIPGVKVDKHSTGGVGDKTSLVLTPIAAAAGLISAKMSGRGLGHTGGTLDKLEAIPGFLCQLEIPQFKRQLRQIGLAIVGQTSALAPADKLFYSLRDVTATVDSLPLIAASIMCKKLAVGADVLVLDVKYGSGAVLPQLEQARELACSMVELAQNAGMRAAAFLTSMEQPLGWAVGNALEVREALDVLEGGGPPDLRQVSLAIAAEQIFLASLRPSREAALDWAAHLLDSGAALEKLVAMVRAQGGSDDFRLLPRAAFQIAYKASATGWLSRFATQKIGWAAMLLGAGRCTREDKIDPAAGIVWEKKCGAQVKAGETLAWLHCNDQSRLAEAIALLDQAIIIEDQPAPVTPLIREIIGNDGLRR